jgi:hypothetical protein
MADIIATLDEKKPKTQIIFSKGNVGKFANLFLNVIFYFSFDDFDPLRIGCSG